MADHGEGTLTPTPEGQAPIRTDLDLMMAAAGLRGVVVQAPETGGIELAVKSDVLGVRTSTAKARGRKAEEAEVTRLRLRLEGSRPVRCDNEATQRDYSLGWRLTRAGSPAGSLELSMEARRRESANDEVAPEHEIGLTLTGRF